MNLLLDQLHSIPKASPNGQHPVFMEPWSPHCNVGFIFIVLHPAVSEIQYEESTPASHYLTSLRFLQNFATSFSDSVTLKLCTFKNTCVEDSKFFC